MSHFKVGQKVVCIDDDVRPLTWRPGSALKRGAIYTIRQTGLVFRQDGSLCVLLVEIRNYTGKAASPRTEQGYREARFEALPKKATSIEVFRTILRNARRGIDMTWSERSQIGHFLRSM